MKLFGDYLLNEMSLNRSKVIQKITSQVPNFEDNFVKITLMSKHTAVNHWKQETNTAITICKRYRVKGTNKPFENEEIVNLIIENSNLESVIEDVVEDYNIKTPNLLSVTNEKYKEWLTTIIENNKA